MMATFSLLSRIIVAAFIVIAFAVILTTGVIIIAASPALAAAWIVWRAADPPRTGLSRKDKRILRATEAQLATISSEDAEVAQ